MNTPEALNPLKTYTTTMETILLTTIHLINGDRILTKIDENDEDLSNENAFGEFFCTGI